MRTLFLAWLWATCSSPGGAGYVMLSSSGSGSSLSAAFSTDVAMSTPPPVLAEGGDCQLLGVGSGPPPMATFVSAGVLSVAVQGSTHTSNPDAMHAYDETWPDLILSGAEPVQISASGDGVAAFDVMLTAPSGVVLPFSFAASDPASAPMVPRTSDIVIPIGTLGTSEVEISILQTSSLLLCHAPASQGSLTIPAALLMQVAAGPVSIGTKTFAEQRSIAGSYLIRFDVVQEGGGYATLM